MANDFVIEDGVLKKYNGPGGDVVVPEGVTAIGWQSFKGSRDIRRVTLPEGVEIIHAFAFADCKNLQRINFPESLETIDDMAFRFCEKLTEVRLPQRMVRIGACAFGGCKRMKKLTLPASLKRISPEIFDQLTELEELVIPCQADDADQIQLYNTRLFDPEQITEIFIKGIIRTCPPMEKAIYKRVNTPSNRKRILSDYLYQKDAAGVARFLSLIAKMPAKELDEYIQAAEHMPEIRMMLLEYKNKRYSPADLARKETEQAEKDLGLRERNVADWKKIYKINAQGHITGYKRTDPVAEIPPKVRNTQFQVGAKAFFDCEFPESVTIADGVTLIDRDAFFGCKKLSEITIPSTLEKIGASAFRDCVSLTHVRFPGTVTTIGANAFTGCTGLTIHAPAKSKIIKYAAKNKIPFVEE